MSARAELESLLKLINVSARQAIDEYEKRGQEVPSLDSTAEHPLDHVNNTLALKKTIRTLEGACTQLCATLAPPAHTIMNRAQAFDWACMRVAIQAGIADVLAKHSDGLHVTELSAEVNIDREKLARVLRLLATKHCFREVDTNVFANNRLSLMLQSSSTVADLAQVHTHETVKGASVLYENLINPTCSASCDPVRSPFMYAIHGNKADGNFFDWLKAHPDRRAIFGRAMIGINQVMGSLAVLENFPWSKFSTVCDIGSGVGGFAIPLARSFPHITITLHDLPETLAQAEEVWAQDCPEAVHAERIKFSPLNFFEEVPVKGQDIYHLRNITHNWHDPHASLILRNTSKAMLPHSRLLIHDYVLQHLNRKYYDSETENLTLDVAPKPMLPNFGAGNIRMYNQDITMLFSLNAKERTLEEFISLAATVGLQLNHVWDLAESCLLEFKLTEE